MLEKEKGKNPDERLDFITIATPNDTHYEIAKAFMLNGFHIICDKPLCTTVAEGEELAEIARERGLVFTITYNYTGYPLVRQAKEMIKNGELGKILKVIMEYQQGWLVTPLERQGHKQASWRTDPARSGGSQVSGDLGTHAVNLLEYVTGKKITELCADVRSVVEGRVMEDDVNILVHMEDGVSGILMVSQICAGEENALKLRVYGTKSSIEWHQENPNVLLHKIQGAPDLILKSGNDYLHDLSKSSCNIVAGHPEGFFEAFANIYKESIELIRSAEEGRIVPFEEYGCPSVLDGVRGMRFIDAVLRSGKANEKWTKL
jgi:predicted dehydrogenase